MEGDVAMDVWAMQVCEKFGWTLEYIDRMPMEELALVMGYIEGMERATKK